MTLTCARFVPFRSLMSVFQTGNECIAFTVTHFLGLT